MEVGKKCSAYAFINQYYYERDHGFTLRGETAYLSSSIGIIKLLLNIKVDL